MTDTNRIAAALSDRYVIERELGSGGMATVYLAHDVRHDRKVALKVLRPELSAILGAERFLAEIKTTANLQHPHILSLFDSGEADGLVYYVMPFVDGESLRDRLSREKQLPVDDAVRIAREVADALQYAHKQGVVHRDIKPENILLHGGHAMVADFGIALAASRSEGGTRMTETGMSLGTPHYMSPEQAMGEREITPKADIYALGCVLYEMLTAEPPFTGATAQAIIARVMTEEPRSLTLQRRTIPPHVEAAVQVALAKLPADRFATAAEFADALARPGAIPVTAHAVAAASRPRRAGLRVAAAVGAAGLALGLAAGWWLRPAPPSGPLVRFPVAVQPYTVLGSGFARLMALSPDGRLVAFVGRGARGNQVFVRALADSIPRPVSGTEGAFVPVFSPDGREIAFWTPQQRLLKVSVDGGTPLELAEDAGNVIAWMPDGAIVFADPTGHALSVLAPGGARRLIARSDTAAFLALTPLPGRRVLATLLSGSRNQTAVVAVSLKDGAMRDVGLHDVLMAKVVPRGYVVYQRRAGGALLAAPFDLRRLRVRGEGRPVAPPARITFRVMPQWDVSNEGTLAYIGVAPFELVLVERNGGSTVLQGEARNYHHPRFSPDGRRVVLDITEGDARDLWILDLAGKTMSRLTVGEVANDPYWSPDGRRVAYTVARGLGRGVFTRLADGSGAAESLLVDGVDHSSGSWSPDGRTLVVSTSLSAGLWLVPAAPGGRAARVEGSRSSEGHPAFSPDGRWIAYVSDESGRQEVYVRPFPGAGGRIQVSASGGTEPAWSRDGREVFYREDVGSGSRLAVADVRRAPAFVVERRTPLFDVSGYVPSEDHANYDVSPDGRRFVMVHSPEAGHINIIQSWAAQLAERR